jgi:hypothetical protein
LDLDQPGGLVEQSEAHRHQPAAATLEHLDGVAAPGWASRALIGTASTPRAAWVVIATCTGA